MAKVRFVGSNINKVIEIKKGSLILDASLASNIELPFGCRYGACHACIVEVIKGIENIESPELKVITKGKSTNIKTCISKIKTDGEITIKV
jgi:ferredoxin